MFGGGQIGSSAVGDETRGDELLRTRRTETTGIGETATNRRGTADNTIIGNRDRRVSLSGRKDHGESNCCQRNELHDGLDELD